MQVILQTEPRLNQDHKDVLLPAHPQRTFLIGERTWTDIEPQEYSFSDYAVSKKLIRLLRHGSLPRDDDGAIEFWRIKDYLQNHFVYSQHWSDEKWKSASWQKEEDTRKYFSIVLMLQEKFFITWTQCC